jgi:uncharacterized membrane protein
VSKPSLLAVAYDRGELAERALDALRELADAGAVALKDAAVVVNTGGGVQLHQTRALAAGEGIVGGGTLGLLLGLAFGVPIIGAIVGTAVGGGLSAFDTGLSDADMRRLAEHLDSGRAVLFALVADADWPLIRDRLETYGGELVASEVADEVAAALEAPIP